MPFAPALNEELHIGAEVYRVAEHPAAPGIPYGQEGRYGTVWQLISARDPHDHRALKVFAARYRVPSLATVADRLEAFAQLPGLQVCHRTVLIPQRHGPLLRQHPDLIYAVLMPWIEGPTWMQIMLEKQPLTQQQSLLLGRSLATILVGLEQRGVAHCDLSGPNIMLPALATITGARPQTAVALVDVEQLFGPGLDRPDFLPSGSLGYAHHTAASGVWSTVADRFAGAILLAEMLAWRDQRIRNAAHGETYFDPMELQQPGTRYDLLLATLREHYGERAAALFQQAWQSTELADCPTFGEWITALPDAQGTYTEEEPGPAVVTVQPTPPPVPIDPFARSINNAQEALARGDRPAALVHLHDVLRAAPKDSHAWQQADSILRELQPARRPTPLPWIGAIVAVLILSVGGWLIFRDGAPPATPTVRILPTATARLAAAATNTPHAAATAAQATAQAMDTLIAARNAAANAAEATVQAMDAAIAARNAAATAAQATAQALDAAAAARNATTTARAIAARTETAHAQQTAASAAAADARRAAETARARQTAAAAATATALRAAEAAHAEQTAAAAATATTIAIKTRQAAETRAAQVTVFAIDHHGCQWGIASNIGQVKGRVFDRNGKPIVGAVLEVKVDGYSPLPPSSSDADGWYGWNFTPGQKIRFKSLKVGGQAVTFSPEDFTVESIAGCYQWVDFRQQ